MSVNSLGEYFLKQRNNSGMTREQVCEHVESLKVADLAAFEEGYGNLPMSTIMALANVLNADPAEILNLITDESQRSALLADDQSLAAGDEDADISVGPRGRRIH